MTPLFPGQQENEEICLVVREHWMVFFLRFLAWLMFVAILFFVDWFIGRYAPGLKNDPYVTYVNLFKSVYMMFLMLGLLIIWVIYYLNVQIITNERVVDIVQNSLLNRKVSELHLSRLEDVTAEVNGFLPTFLDYGNVYIQTAGETERFEFVRVPNPAAIEKLILDLYEKLPPDQKEHKDPFNK
ncbi:MAG: PH domain-containing protein [Candidatus Doudnabacteria bacterium]|nr:PH domain-containing protein [Candidatus Doudnabacteria bacterium]